MAFSDGQGRTISCFSSLFFMFTLCLQLWSSPLNNVTLFLTRLHPYFNGKCDFKNDAPWKVHLNGKCDFKNDAPWKVLTNLFSYEISLVQSVISHWFSGSILYFSFSEISLPLESLKSHSFKFREMECSRLRFGIDFFWMLQGEVLKCCEPC